MSKNNFIKISAAVFIFLGIIISLFPPFEFSKRNILPVKKYDFLFGNNRKDIALRYDYFYMKFYDKDTLAYYKYLWKDYDFTLYISSADTFSTARKYLFKISKLQKFRSKYPEYSDMNDSTLAAKLAQKYPDAYGDLPGKVKKKDTSNPYDQFDEKTSGFVFKHYVPSWVKNLDNQNNQKPWEKDWNKKPNPFDQFDPTTAKLVNGNYTSFDDKVEDAVNYIEVKNEYLKSPDDWDYKYITRIDSIKKFNEYNIAKPIYYLLDRKILFGELIVEYILDFFVSIIVGYLISKLKLKVRKAEI
jgi:hypothetical protein